MREPLLYRLPQGIDEIHWLCETQGPPNPNFYKEFKGWFNMNSYLWMDEPTYLLYTLRWGEYNG